MVAALQLDDAATLRAVDFFGFGNHRYFKPLYVGMMRSGPVTALLVSQLMEDINRELQSVIDRARPRLVALVSDIVGLDADVGIADDDLVDPDAMVGEKEIQERWRSEPSMSERDRAVKMDALKQHQSVAKHYGATVRWKDRSTPVWRFRTGSTKKPMPKRFIDDSVMMAFQFALITTAASRCRAMLEARPDDRQQLRKPKALK